MRKVLLLLFSLIIFQIPAFAINKKMPPSSNGENNLPNIFIYKIPDTKFVETTEDADAAENEYVQEKPLTSADNSDEEIALNVNAETDDDIVLGATVLKGYAEYIEDTESIYLKDDNNNFVLNLKVPQKISGSESLDLSKFSNTRTITRHTPTEYNIAPQSITAASKKGDFTIGALYGNEVDNIAMLESETGLFTKYEKDKFAVSSSFKKSLNTTYAQYYNTISVCLYDIENQ